MPHKHTRIRDNDPSRYNLPPTERARPLPVGKHGQSVFTSTPEDNVRRKAKAKRKRADDDTPRAFARIMAFQTSGRKLPDGLDEGLLKPRASKKAKPNPSPSTATASNDVSTSKARQPKAKAHQQQGKDKPQLPKILPGESLSEFNARVNAALPVSGLTRKLKKNDSTADIPALRERRTKTEKRLHKMYDEWRQQDTKRKEKLDEARELEDELRDEEEVNNHGNRSGGAFAPPRYEPEEDEDDEGKKGKKRRKRMIGEANDKDDDPWAELKKKRDAPKGLHDVAQAPPEFKAVPREKFKVRNGAVARVADVPGASGSLKRREELGEERKAVIERYRAMMGKGGGL